MAFRYKILNIVDSMTTFNRLTNKDNKSIYLVNNNTDYLIFLGDKPINVKSSKAATNNTLGLIKGSEYITIKPNGEVVVDKAKKLGRKVKIGNAYFDGSKEISLKEIGAVDNVEFEYYKKNISSLFEDILTIMENHTHTVSDITDFPTSLPANGGNAATADKLKTARTINGISFDGSANITITDDTKSPTTHKHQKSDITDFPTSLPANGGNAATADKLKTARTINGISFDGSANINIADNTKSPIGHKHPKSDITDFPTSMPANGGNAATADKLKTARNINGISFDGSANITITDDTKSPIGHKHPKSDITDFPTSLPANGGNSATADKLKTARTINGISFDGTADINIADNTKSPIGHKHPKSDITDFPTSLPANGGNAATVNGIKITVSATSPSSPSTGDLWIY